MAIEVVNAKFYMDNCPKPIVKPWSVYISGPYTAPTPEGVEANVRKAAELAYEYMKAGWVVFCPHTMTHFVHIWYNLPHEDLTYEDYMYTDLYFVDVCDALATTVGWRNSSGSLREIERAKMGGKILFLSDD